MNEILKNWLDVVILGVLALYAIRGLVVGFPRALFALVGFVLTFVVSLYLYAPASRIVERAIRLPAGLVRALVFLTIWVIAMAIYAVIARAILSPVPAFVHRSWLSRIAGALPSLAQGLVALMLALVVAAALPLPAFVRDGISTSRLGSELLQAGSAVELQLRQIVSGAVSDGLTVFTVRPRSDERVDLRFTAPDARVDEAAERKMLELVNAERVKAGLQPLTHDPALQTAARRHSQDMLARGYFAHVSPEGTSPAARITEAGGRFLVTGENIALAPTVEVSHLGLMNSPGHRANILSPQFSRAGIGVYDAGIRGKMFTQEFAGP